MVFTKEHEKVSAEPPSTSVFLFNDFPSNEGKSTLSSQSYKAIKLSMALAFTENSSKRS